MWPTGPRARLRSDHDFHGLIEHVQEVREAFDRETAQAPAEQRAHLRLVYSEKFRRFELGEPALLDDSANLKDQPGLDQHLVGVWHLEVLENLPAADGMLGQLPHQMTLVTLVEAICLTSVPGTLP